jgi:SAM-dependent methyltransferase
MIGNDSDKSWKYYGEKDPYFGVLTHEDFSSDNIDKNRGEFFRTGQEYIDGVVANIHRHITPDFHPAVAVDFGCGVGRLVRPLAAISGTVYGVDISEGMLKEAEKNCAGQPNVKLVLSDDTLSRLPSGLDFIHSYIVFQHIPVSRGMQMARILIDRLNPGGIGVLHFTYAIPGENASKRRFMRKAFAAVPLLYKLRSVMKNERGPMMQMNEYSLNEISKTLQEAGCKELFISFTNHDFLGAVFYFRKEA